LYLFLGVIVLIGLDAAGADSFDINEIEELEEEN
jgi:hypothetical protein